jgi:hypothetical protein
MGLKRIMLRERMFLRWHRRQELPRLFMDYIKRGFTLVFAKQGLEADVMSVAFGFLIF